MMAVMVAIRLAEDLAGVADPAWPAWLELAASAGVRVVMLPVSRDDGLEVLFRLQVTARSMLGALALGSGGLLVDHGWIRVLGGGSEFLPDVASVNRLGVPAEDASPPPWLTVAFDVLGGRFAVNGGGLPGQPGEVCYWGRTPWPGPAWAPGTASSLARCSATGSRRCTRTCAGPTGRTRWRPCARIRASPCTRSCAPPRAIP